MIETLNLAKNNTLSPLRARVTLDLKGSGGKNFMQFLMMRCQVPERALDRG